MLALTTNAFCLESFNNINVPYYAKVEATNGASPIVFDSYYDGVSKIAVIGPPPKNKKDNLKILANLKTSDFYMWTENDPRKALITMNQLQFAKTLGVNNNDIKKKGTLVGEKQHLGEKCEHWRLDLTLENNGKQVKASTESCLSSDGIQLWGRENEKITMNVLELKRGKQPVQYFQTPKDYEILDLSKLMQQLRNIQKQ